MFPCSGVVTNSANAIDPKLKMPYVQSWSFGVQRELSSDMVVESRYVGTLAAGLDDAESERGQHDRERFLNEFKLAQENLYANMAAAGARRSGTSDRARALRRCRHPGLLQRDSGGAGGGPGALYVYAVLEHDLYQSAGFTNPNPTTFVPSMATDNATAAQRANGLAAGLPPNLFVVNPDKMGGANLLTNFGGSTITPE